jgi:hypothetical protein
LYLYPGAYRNFDDIEEYLTMDELTLMYERAYEMKQDEHRFFAAIQGIDLDDGKKSAGQEVIDRATLKAAAEQLGKTEEQFELEMMFEFVDEDAT